MSDWQERITRETAPAIRVEHELRYRLAAPLIEPGDAWADLGCGNGLAAAAALAGLGARPPARVVLVDREQEVVERAARELGVAEAIRMVGDLTDPDSLDAVSDALLTGGGRATVTCFEVVEHLDTFLPLLEWSGRLARERGVTFVLSVPNDAFWSISNPHHLTCWGEGAFEELRRLLPAEQTMLRQVALSGSALVGFQGDIEERELMLSVGGQSAVATHFIVAFGPRHAELARLALAVQTDMLEQRRWERQRESDLALLQALLQEREQWRAYIHELERELGRPPPGVAQPPA